MNSTTGDFSKVKRLTDELYNRGTQSCVKKQPYFPRKLNLQPLNLNGIKKEIEESWEFDETQTSEINSNVVHEHQNELSSACVEGQNEYPLTDKSNDPEPNEYKPKINNEQRLSIKSYKNNAGISVIPGGKENKVVYHNHREDSFDLDFSGLSLKTPIKEKERNRNIIHSVNNDPKDNESNCPFMRKGQFNEFVTPNVNIIKTRSSLLEKTYLKTPLNSFNNAPVKKLYTPCVINKPIFPQKISPNIPSEDDPADKNEVKPASVILNGLNDYTFKKIKVKHVEYIVLNLLGKGGSSEVFHCYNPENNCHVAIKCVSLQNSASAGGYINEVKLLQQLQNCEKIIKMYDYEILDSQKQLLVVLEKGGEDLSKILKQLASQRSHIPMYMLLFYWMEILYAVKQIHSHGIIHSDLKPANFLKANEGLKLIDFGIASSVQSDMTSIIKSVPEGSCNYISPEGLNNDSTANFENQNSSNGKPCAKYKLHYKSDVWSLGCILYQLVYRRTPFQHIPHLWSKLTAIMNPDYKIDYPNKDWISPKIINTIQRCLQHNVSLRPSVTELIAEYEEILQNI